MKLVITFDTDKDIEEGRITTKPTFTDEDMKKVRKKAKELGTDVASLLIDVDRAIFNTFNNGVGRNEHLTFDELLKGFRKDG